MKHISNADSLENYLSLPRANKYCGPFYRIPCRMLMGEWSKFDKYIKARHPIQYFFRDTMPGELSFIRHRVKAAYWYVRHWIQEDNKVKFGPPNYYDSDSRIEMCLEKIFMDFYNIEYLQGYVNWDSEPAIKAEILEIHKYFTEEKPSRDKKLDDLDHELYGGNEDWIERLNSRSPEHLVKCRVGWDMENDNSKRHDEILIKLMKIRRSLWT